MVVANGIGYDSVTANAMPKGGSVYYAYIDGAYVNLNAVKTDFAGASIKTITTQALAADMYDCEWGNGTPADCPNYWHLAKAIGVTIPEIYCPASWVTQVRNEMTKAGIPSSEYFIHSAHYGVGPHICDGTCGYPQADNTQWIDMGNYDISIMGARYMGWLHPSSTNPTVVTQPTPAPTPTPIVNPVVTPTVVTPTYEDNDMFCIIKNKDNGACATFNGSSKTHLFNQDDLNNVKNWLSDVFGSKAGNEVVLTSETYDNIPYQNGLTHPPATVQ